MAEKSRVLTSGSWTFNKSLLVLTSPTAADQLLDMNFNLCAFWVQIHCVPFECMTKDIAQLLGARIGEVEEVDCMGGDDWAEPFIRVKIRIDINLFVEV